MAVVSVVVLNCVALDLILEEGEEEVPEVVGLVSVGGVTVTPVTWSSTAITVQVPVGAPIGNADVVVTSGALSSQPAYFLVTQTFGCTLPLD